MDKAVRVRATEVIPFGIPGMYLAPEPTRAEESVITEILEDQNPHSIAELAAHANLPLQAVSAFVHFLEKYALVTYDEQEQMVMITPDFALLQ